MKTLIIATNNKGKLAEFKYYLGELFEVKTLKEMGIVSDPEETGDTFESNASIKSNAVFSALKAKYTPLEMEDFIIIADDSGVTMKDNLVLSNLLGVRSARLSKDVFTPVILEEMKKLNKSTDDINNEIVMMFSEKGDNIKYVTCLSVYFVKEDITMLIQKDCLLHISEKINKGNGFAYDYITYFEKESGEEILLSDMNKDQKALISARGFCLKELKSEVIANELQ